MSVWYTGPEIPHTYSLEATMVATTKSEDIELSESWSIYDDDNDNEDDNDDDDEDGGRDGSHEGNKDNNDNGGYNDIFNYKVILCDTNKSK